MFLNTGILRCRYFERILFRLATNFGWLMAVPKCWRCGEPEVNQEPSQRTLSCDTNGQILSSDLLNAIVKSRGYDQGSNHSKQSTPRDLHSPPPSPASVCQRPTYCHVDSRVCRPRSVKSLDQNMTKAFTAIVG